MFYSTTHKVVFIAVPKTGTRTIYNVLEKHFGGKPYIEHHATIPPEFAGYFSFCTVRNPYDRVASMWWSTSKRGLDKRGFIKMAKTKGWDNSLNSFMKVVREQTVHQDRILRTQKMFIAPNKINAKLRFDHLEEDFNKLPFVTEPIILPSLNMTKEVTGPNPNARPPWQTLMDEQTIKLINEVYYEDFAISGYEMITDFAAWEKEQDNE